MAMTVNIDQSTTISETIAITRIHPNDEITRDPVYLFQRRRLQLISLPDGYTMEDCETILDGNGECVTLKEMFDGGHIAGEFDVPCVIEEWVTELVFFTRDAGERYGEAKAYNYPDGWRVYCVPAHGELAELLKSVTAREEPRLTSQIGEPP
jgi:hypothetical protein